jgi:hypothetical protein
MSTPCIQNAPASQHLIRMEIRGRWYSRCIANAAARSNTKWKVSEEVVRLRLAWLELFSQIPERSRRQMERLRTQPMAGYEIACSVRTCNNMCLRQGSSLGCSSIHHRQRNSRAIRTYATDRQQNAHIADRVSWWNNRRRAAPAALDVTLT